MLLGTIALFADSAVEAQAAAASANQSATLTMIMTVLVAVIGLGNNWLNRRYDKDMALLTERMAQCELGRAKLESEILSLRVHLNMQQRGQAV